jgi:hypothetical protein
MIVLTFLACRCRIKHTGREHQNIHASKIRLQITLQPANANLDDESSLVY